MNRSNLTKGNLFFSVFIILSTYLLLFSCKSDKKQQEAITPEIVKDPIIEITTNVMDFQMIDTINSGWNTFKYINKSTEPHFVLFDDYPDGKTLDTVRAKVMPPFDKGMALIMKGQMEDAMLEFGKLPKWFSEVKFVGGTGLISPGHETNVTVKLTPGYHIMECYVKMANGQFHASMGMVKEFWVLEEDTGIEPPKPDINITISSTEGILYDKPVTQGKQVFAVTFKDQTVHEHFLGHDINLVKLSDDANIEELEKWMDWSSPTGLMTPIPEGVTFLGGANNNLAGTTQYFEVVIENGLYAFISEVPNSKSKGMLKTFSIKE